MTFTLDYIEQHLWSGSGRGPICDRWTVPELARRSPLPSWSTDQASALAKAPSHGDGFIGRQRALLDVVRREGLPVRLGRQIPLSRLFSVASVTRLRVRRAPAGSLGRLRAGPEYSGLLIA